MAGKDNPNLRSLRESIPSGSIDLGPSRKEPSFDFFVPKLRGHFILDLRGSSLRDGDLTTSEDSSHIGKDIGSSLWEAVYVWCSKHEKELTAINTLFPGWEVLGLEYSAKPVGEVLAALEAISRGTQ